MDTPQLLKEIESRLKELAEETDKVRASEFFKEYLDTMSRFWNYSYHNQLLIYFQKKDATRVAGFVTWNGLGRSIKAGSKAIRILAPFTFKQYDEEQDKEIEVIRFYPVSVFDVSQTEGQELPDIDIEVQGEEHLDLLHKLLEFCYWHDIEVDFEELGINNLYGYSLGGRIAIGLSQSVNTQVNTLLHEISHELIHRKDSKASRQQKEIQAEGVAYVVSKHFGLEIKSFNYLALYDADYKKIMENLEVIAEASKKLIEFLVT